MDARNLADLYDLPLLDWSSIERRLGEGVTQAPATGGPDRHTCWLATVEFDLVVKGTAEKVTDPATVADLAARWAEGGWPARVDDSGTALTAEYSAPSAGSPPWHVYRLVPTGATALQTVEPGGATRWTF